MQILIVLSSPEPEIKWNAVRFGNFLLNEGEDVTIFLNGPAVDLTAGDSATFDADLPHNLHNAGAKTSEILAVIAAGLRRS